MIEVFESFNILPADQCLLLNGHYLRSNHQQLWQLNIAPGSLMFLRVGHNHHHLKSHIFSSDREVYHLGGWFCWRRLGKSS